MLNVLRTLEDEISHRTDDVDSASLNDCECTYGEDRTICKLCAPSRVQHIREYAEFKHAERKFYQTMFPTQGITLR